jgi:hypothetical protein
LIQKGKASSHALIRQGQKSMEGIGDPLLQPRSACKQSHGHDDDESRTVKLNQLVPLTPVTADQSA